MQDEVCYICQFCGEEIVVPVDPTAGAEQQYVEDCPVCCRPQLLHVSLDVDGEATIFATAEQDEE